VSLNGKNSQDSCFVMQVYKCELCKKYMYVYMYIQKGLPVGTGVLIDKISLFKRGSNWN